MKIREFSLDDYTIVRELWQAAGLILRPGDELEDIKLKLQRDPDLFLVAEHDDEIVGSVIGGWDGRRGWIYHLAVKPQQQRKGVGVGLVREVEKRLLAKGAKKVNAQVYKSNERSSRFFKAIGYETQPDLIMIGKQLRK
ncbi:MAG TPA: GNAT family acetyltransferase [Candidatus Bathyarchaeia archaeon]|nr:GNAT family acetyltransferase [Candidatus Bathyarchaeia archaeon]